MPPSRVQEECPPQREARSPDAALAVDMPRRGRLSAAWEFAEGVVSSPVAGNRDGHAALK